MASKEREPAATSVADDAALVRRCQRGEVSAFGALVARHEAKVCAIVRRVMGEGASPEDVADAAQDVFVQAWRALPRFRGDAQFGTWLYRIATNSAIKAWHRRRRQDIVVSSEELPPSVREALAAPEASPAQVVEGRAEARAVRAAIDRLPEKQRTVILLHYFEDYPCEEIAVLLDCSVGTVWSRLHYACRRLRVKLDWPH